MELVYLWVEDYKNIHKQGFNFSPRFECKFYPDYDGNGNLTENSKLEIIEKEYVNIFPKNINITAIVGKNGSGKSSALNAIVNCGEKSFPKEINFILVYQSGDEKFYISNMEITTSIQKVDDFKSLIIYMNREDNDNLPINVGATKLSSYKSHKQVFTNYMEIDTSKKTIVNLLVVELGKIDSSFKLSTFMYLPNRISIKLKSPEELISDHINYTFKNRQEIEDYFMELDDIEYQILIIEYLRNFGRQLNLEIIKDKNKLQLKFKDTDLPKILELYYNPIDKKYINNLTEEEKRLYVRKDGYFHLLDFDLIDEKDRDYNNLSHGEKILFGQLLNIYFYSINHSNKIFLFDEPEISLHPDWQKRYINETYNLLKKMEGDNHFIFSSHSPFLISDLPKHNIIFLDTYTGDDEEVKKGLQKVGNCKVLSKDEVLEKKQTFGANIHTLLSDSFFMKDGLMGEFAKSKIEEVIKFLNNEKSEIKDHKEAESIINIIGEPILQKKLQIMLERYKEENNLINPQDIEKQIQELQEKLNRIKKNG